MDPLAVGIVLAVVVVGLLLVAWAVSRYRRDKGDVPHAEKRSPEDLKAREDLKKLKEQGRYGGPAV